MSTERTFFVIKLAPNEYLQSSEIQEAPALGIPVPLANAHLATAPFPPCRVTLCCHPCDAKRYVKADDARGVAGYARVAKITLIEEELP